MKRDWDVIRKILMKVEELPSEDAVVDSDQIDGVDSAIAAYNMRLLLKAYLIEGGGRPEGVTNAPPWVYATRLTWGGHELLDNIRRETVWKRIKSIAAEKGVDLSIDVVKAIAKMVIEALVGSPG